MFTTGLMMKDQVMEVVDEAKLLGTYITSDLKWNKNTDYLIKEANKRMRLLQPLSLSNNTLLHSYQVQT